MLSFTYGDSSQVHRATTPYFLASLSFRNRRNMPQYVYQRRQAHPTLAQHCLKTYKSWKKRCFWENRWALMSGEDERTTKLAMACAYASDGCLRQAALISTNHWEYQRPSGEFRYRSVYEADVTSTGSIKLHRRRPRVRQDLAEQSREYYFIEQSKQRYSKVVVRNGQKWK